MGISSSRIEVLRRELEGIDHSLTILAAARVDLAVRIIRERMSAGDAVALPSQEDRVFRRARLWARRYGAPEPLVEGFFRGIVAEGKRRALVSRGEGATGHPEFVTVFVTPGSGAREAVPASRPIPAAARKSRSGGGLGVPSRGVLAAAPVDVAAEPR